MSTHALAARPPLSPARIAAIALALTVHLAAFGLMVMPPSLLLGALEEAPAEIVVDFIRAEVLPPPLPVPPVPPPPVRPAPAPRTVAPAVVPVVIAPSAHTVAAVQADPVTESLGDPAPDPGPTLASAAAIAYADVPPPPYPAMARRRRLEGEVLLRVRVDESGRPVEVEIERSSGHRVLDRSAREHVLARWRFQPALLGGRPVQAWARVPVNFRLEGG